MLPLTATVSQSWRFSVSSWNFLKTSRDCFEAQSPLGWPAGRWLMQTKM
ncbi:MAG: hypothetical protein MZW92_27410 [Comamonadaceae bacterium]|nr:hypothetical protein [Comamonadaceae bacterium]